MFSCSIWKLEAAIACWALTMTGSSRIQLWELLTAVASSSACSVHCVAWECLAVISITAAHSNFRVDEA